MRNTMNETQVLFGRRSLLKAVGFGTAAWVLPGTVRADAADDKRPNILWLSCEDISPHIRCFGDEYAITPNIDRLAREGVRYTNAFTTAGVCAPCRSGIITGMYQTTIGTHHMRCTAKLPPTIKAFSTYLRGAGYYCTNNSKTDYQTNDLHDAWDESSGKAHWRNRKGRQPFFAVFNFTGCHESGIAGESKYKSVTKQLKPSQRQDPNKLELPPYYPDTPIVREDWKRNYELITAMDAWAGDLIEQLKEDGLYDSTIVFFWSDHGVGLPRAKRWLYDSGTHIPLVVRVPEKLRTGEQAGPGLLDDRLISSIDFGPTVMNLAGLRVPDYMQGRPFLGPNLPKPRDYIFGARDRMDERYDIIRSVRDKRHRYIRNYEPLKPYYQYMNTPEKGTTMKEIRRVHAEGRLPPAAGLFMADRKPVEELYDLRDDPHEIKNLAQDPKYRDVLNRMREVHRQWVRQTKDLGLIPEPEIMEREQKYGNRYAILRQPDGDALNSRLGDIAAMASAGQEALPKLIAALEDRDAAIRYWGATGIGNIGQAAAGAEGKMVAALEDGSVSVRVAAARALCMMGEAGKALPVLIEALRGEHPWGRLQAAIVLDSIGEMARPAENALKEALTGQPNNYITRVANHALNVMNGTSNAVG
ncbi:MAG TPA: sulfatase-like hydrolase/transferase [Sedimentisphaerales bacterium]|nr:sulfatase-like hydrolase/transferase [Sedimentisphaerales bacterium]